jgi:hypothetical protein
VIAAFVSVIYPGKYYEVTELIEVKTGKSIVWKDTGLKAKVYNEQPGTAKAIVFALFSMGVVGLTYWVSGLTLDRPISAFFRIMFDIFAILLALKSIKDSFQPDIILGGLAKILAVTSLGVSLAAFSLDLLTIP